MFYVREKISDTAEITVEIHDDNVFCTCPGCGSDVRVDLAELFNDGEGDLYSTSVYCPACSKSRLEDRYE
jgi:transposase-like protein